MKKLSLVVLAIISLSYSFAQEKAASFEPVVKEEKNVFTVVNPKDKKVALFFTDKKSINALLFDETLQLSDTISTNYSNKEVDDIIGYSFTGPKYYVYWSGSDDKQVIAQCYDFDTKKSSSAPIAIDMGKEKIIDKITVQNTFYIITALKHTSILNFYCFTDGKMNKKTVDFSAYRFIDSYNKKVSFWEMYNEFNGTVYYNGIADILDETPASLVFSTNKKKAFIKDNSIFFTFDTNENFTQTLTVNLSDFSTSQKIFSQVPIMKEGEFDVIDSNSFFVNNNLIQIKTDPTVLYITIKNMEGTELKKLALYPGKEIEFKNSEIFQEEGGIKSARVLDNSKQLIRKISNLNPSVSSYFYNGNYHLVIGGVSYPQQNAMMYGGLIGGLTGALIGAAISSNYSINNLNSYSNKRVVYINCLFDQDFNTIKSEGKRLAFDKLRLFTEENNKLINHSIFKLNNKLYMGGYDKTSKLYTFYQFED